MEEISKPNFGECEGELVRLFYHKPLPMRLDRWLVTQRTEQSRARIQKFIDAVDDDGSGNIEFPEFLAIINGASNQELEGGVN